MIEAFGRPFGDHFRQSDGDFRAVADVGVVVRQRMRLPGDRIRDFGASVADVHAVQAGKAVQAFLAPGVFDVDAAAAGDDAVRRIAVRVLRHVRGGMKEVGAVPLLELLLIDHVVLANLKLSLPKDGCMECSFAALSRRLTR